MEVQRLPTGLRSWYREPNTWQSSSPFHHIYNLFAWCLPTCAIKSSVTPYLVQKKFEDNAGYFCCGYKSGKVNFTILSNHLLCRAVRLFTWRPPWHRAWSLWFAILDKVVDGARFTQLDIKEGSNNRLGGQITLNKRFVPIWQSQLRDSDCSLVFCASNFPSRHFKSLVQKKKKKPLSARDESWT